MCDCAAKLEQIEQRLTALETGKRTKVRQDFEFEAFWAKYPNKVGKKAAQKAFLSAKDRPQIDDLLDAIDRAMKSQKWKDGFIPNPTTWLNQGRWDDEPATAIAVQPKAQVKVEPRPVQRQEYSPPPPEVMALLNRIGKGM